LHNRYRLLRSSDDREFQRMRIVYVEVDNFRGISLRWQPGPRVNCLIGPGDSTKTTVLDAIELAMNPRSYAIADDSDFFGALKSGGLRQFALKYGSPA
jgi:predicted ATP-dependent endonuclease of OLD family